MTKQPRGNLARREARRDPVDRVLIVCEGEKTEPNYFRDLIRKYRLTAANVTIAGAGADPLTVVEKAKALQEAERKADDRYDHVFCVFDRDEHKTFDEASRVAERNDIELARSWPCFEFWLLLHFTSARRPYARSGRKSPADNCISDLLQHCPEYTKAAEGVFIALQTRLDAAMVNSRKTHQDAMDTNERNPSTEIHRLVGYLKSLSQELAELR